MASRRGKAVQYRGVTLHSITLRWEAHIWEPGGGGRMRRGRQWYLGGYFDPVQAARASDAAQLKLAIERRKPQPATNFAACEYAEEMRRAKDMTFEAFVEHVKAEASRMREEGDARTARGRRARVVAPAAPAALQEPSAQEARAECAQSVLRAARAGHASISFEEFAHGLRAESDGSEMTFDQLAEHALLEAGAPVDQVDIEASLCRESVRRVSIGLPEFNSCWV